jgi:hypothetical protein
MYNHIHIDLGEKIMIMPSMTKEVFNALDHVRKAYEKHEYEYDYITVTFFPNNSWLYFDSYSEPFSFDEVDIDIDILQAALDSAPYLPISYTLDKSIDTYTDYLYQYHSKD